MSNNKKAKQGDDSDGCIKIKNKYLCACLFSLALFFLFGAFLPIAQADLSKASAQMDFDGTVIGGTAIVSYYPKSEGNSYSEAQIFNKWDLGLSILNGGTVGSYDIALGSYQDTSSVFSKYDSLSAGKTFTDGLMTAGVNSKTVLKGDQHSVRSVGTMGRVLKVLSTGTVTFSKKYTSNFININATNGYGWGTTWGYLTLRYWDKTYGVYTEGMYEDFGLGWTDYSPQVSEYTKVDSGLVYHSTFTSPLQTKNILISKYVKAGDVIAIQAGVESRVAVWQDIVPNDPPTVPKITGPTLGIINTNYSFKLYSTDPNGNPLRYGVDWDNNNTVDQWYPATLYVNSGVAQNAVRQWPTIGAKTFKVKACDNKNSCSAFASRTITLSPPAAVPTLTFSSSPATVNEGESATLTWNTQNVASCWAQNPLSWQGWKAFADGSHVEVVSPVVTTTYDLECWDTLGVSTGKKTATITVIPCVPTYSDHFCSASEDIDCALSENCGKISIVTAVCMATNSCTSETDIVPNSDCVDLGIDCANSTSNCSACPESNYNWREVAP